MTAITCDALLEQADQEIVFDMTDLLSRLDYSDFTGHRPTAVAA